MTNPGRKIWIAPSLLSADFGRLAEEIRSIEEAGCDLLHVDVMDGHFVPNITIGPVVVQSIRKYATRPLDVHLMIENPSRYIEEFRRAGSDWITIHVEAEPDIAGTLAKIRSLGAKAGLSLRPKTPLSAIEPYLSQADLLLVMSVEPGFGGQSFMPDMMEKVRALRPKYKGLISVDGGVNLKTVDEVLRAGADIIVSGTGVFGEKDRPAAIRRLREVS
ncbi:MAG: ribulose-phosphate 3-epimerase [Candidatus Omnitrophota bacterium]|jgi:ribulose-phosphate 3-epimerase